MRRVCVRSCDDDAMMLQNHHHHPIAQMMRVDVVKSWSDDYKRIAYVACVRLCDPVMMR